MIEVFKKYWTIRGERVDDWTDVERRVLVEGVTAIEVSAPEEPKAGERYAHVRERTVDDVNAPETGSRSRRRRR